MAFSFFMKELTHSKERELWYYNIDGRKTAAAVNIRC